MLGGKKGPLGKLHNLVVYIQRTPQRRSKFSALSHGLGLVRDNSRRWNSWKSEIDRALKPQIKEAIQGTVTDIKRMKKTGCSLKIGGPSQRLRIYYRPLRMLHYQPKVENQLWKT
jgi:hypothetical protein